MNSIGYVVAWACVGLAAALAGCIWPFRAGVTGIAINMFAAVVGAVAMGYVFIGLGFSESARDPQGPMAAAMGALSFLALVHLTWGAMRRWRLRFPRPVVATGRSHLILASVSPTWPRAPSRRASSPSKKP
jgi:hypothetical protein